VTIPEIARSTKLDHVKMLFTEPLVILITLYLGLNFTVVFQWFISVPTALGIAYDFGVRRAGLAFISAIVSVVLALISSSLIEALFTSKLGKSSEMYLIEKRLVPAIVGSLFVAGALFWIAFTAIPSIPYLSPIFSTGVYI
jgi:MFS transporter, DHA1 family, multidrug resistance protein